MAVLLFSGVRSLSASVVKRALKNVIVAFLK